MCWEVRHVHLQFTFKREFNIEYKHLKPYCPWQTMVECAPMYVFVCANAGVCLQH